MPEGAHLLGPRLSGSHLHSNNAPMIDGSMSDQGVTEPELRHAFSDPGGTAGAVEFSAGGIRSVMRCPLVLLSASRFGSSLRPRSARRNDPDRLPKNLARGRETLAKGRPPTRAIPMRRPGLPCRCVPVPSIPGPTTLNQSRGRSPSDTTFVALPSTEGLTAQRRLGPQPQRHISISAATVADDSAQRRLVADEIQ